MFPSISPHQSSPPLAIFDEWNEEKKKIQTKIDEEKLLPEEEKKKKRIYINEREIWWVSMGQNIWGESYGKWKNFARPVYIFRKFSMDSFLAIPLTSKEKEWSWYLPIEFKWMKRILILPQMKYMSANRLLEKMADVPENSLEKYIDNEVKKFLRL
jgi:mRNA interferase MazF